jgi:hypothetical protein
VRDREEQGHLKLHGAYFAIAEGVLHVLDEQTGRYAAGLSYSAAADLFSRRRSQRGRLADMNGDGGSSVGLRRAAVHLHPRVALPVEGARSGAMDVDLHAFDQSRHPNYRALVDYDLGTIVADRHGRGRRPGLSADIAVLKRHRVAPCAPPAIEDVRADRDCPVQACRPPGADGSGVIMGRKPNRLEHAA